MKTSVGMKMMRSSRSRGAWARSYVPNAGVNRFLCVLWGSSLDDWDSLFFDTQSLPM